MHASIGGMTIATFPQFKDGWKIPLPVPAAFLAAILFVGATMGFGAALDGYSQLRDPVATLGALGMPRAIAFNLLGFVAPGLLLAHVAVGLYGRLTAAGNRVARVGALILLFSTLAFAAQGIFALDLGDIDAGSGRLHIAAWSLWWLTSGIGGVLLAAGIRKRSAWPQLAAFALATAVLVPYCSLFTPLAWGFAIPQRIALMIWLGWWLLAALQLNRNAISAQRLSRPTPG
jgi:hypothetical membrane protein